MAVHPTMQTAPPALLIRAIRINAAFSAVSGTALTIGAPWLDDLLGAPAPLLVAIGVGLLGFVAVLLSILRRPTLRQDARLVVAADLLWIVAAVPIIALDLLTPTGTALLALVTVAVGVITIAQLRGLLTS